MASKRKVLTIRKKTPKAVRGWLCRDKGRAGHVVRPITFWAGAQGRSSLGINGLWMETRRGRPFSRTHGDRAWSLREFRDLYGKLPIGPGEKIAVEIEL